MATQINYEDLKKEYDYFKNPVVIVEVEGKEISKSKTGLTVGDLDIESTGGYEAGIASFVIYETYNTSTCEFEYKKAKQFVMLGAQVSISVGYGSNTKEVFCGFISNVNFFFQESEGAGIRVSCMDVKGIMMANCYSRQLTAMSYSEGVQEIFNSETYTELKDRGVIKSLTIEDTPDKEDLAGGLLGSVTDAAGVGNLADAAGGLSDSLTDATLSPVTNMASTVGNAVDAATGTADSAKEAAGQAKNAAAQLNAAAGNVPGVGGIAAPGVPGTATDKSVEMVAESDYEFVVKAAKKYNFDFFVSAGHVYFRKAKNFKDVLMELSPATGMRNMDVEYNVTGLVGKVEVRSTDVGKASQITNTVKLNNKLSKSRYASKLVKDVSMVYLDPTANSKKEAGYRAQYLAEDVAYRYGTLTAEFIGLPELVVGRYIKLVNMGDPVNNLFYIMSVRHTFERDAGFVTKIIAKAAGLGGSYSVGGAGGGLLGGVLGDKLSGVMDTVDSVRDEVDSAMDQAGEVVAGAAGQL